MSLSQPPGEFPCVVCWDRASRPRVLDTDALRVLPEVFQATHSPSFLQEEGVAAGISLRLPEDEYVTRFLTHDDPRPLDLVVGGSGTGKSHLIRWLAHEAQRRNPGAGERWCVVLVPRSSANLAEVVRCILRGFEGEVVSHLQGELDRAAKPMSPEEACRRVLNELELVLRRDAPSLPAEERELGGLLPDLLRDPAVSRRLLRAEDGILSRLSAHFFGHRESVAEIDPARLRWREEDLRLTPLEVQRAALDARELASQLMTDEQEREAACAVLNRMTAALSGLLGLRRGDLTRALKEIRKELLRRGRELVLLLEDLSVSQGLDAELLEALIIGDRDGDEPLCRLRAAVGLTGEDHAKLRDNILGRVRKTVLCNVPVADSDGAPGGLSIDDFAAFAGRYLNAARYSLQELQAWSKEQDAEQHPLPSFCVRVRCPNLSSCHTAFGSVTLGAEPYGLYPLTPDLLLRLYRQATRQAPGTRSERFLSFNPRRLVGGVLNEMLDQAERTLTERHFPPRHLVEQFGLGAVDIAVRRRLEERHRADLGGRLVNALELYSLDPAAGEPRLPPGIAEALGLPVLAADEFEAWAGGASLAPRICATLRNQVHAAVLRNLEAKTEEFTASSITFEGVAEAAKTKTLLTIRRSAEAAGVLRGLADPARQTGEWRTLAERWYRLWADEVGRELGGRRDEFDRWLAGERLPEAMCESLRSRLHGEVGTRLSHGERARFPQNAVVFAGEQSRTERSGPVLTVRHSASAADVLRELSRREAGGNETAWRESAKTQLLEWASEIRQQLHVGEAEPDLFTAWVSGAPVDDGTLSVWRALVYDAVSAAIDWDTEPGLAPLSGLFMARYIHFEGQFVRSPTTPVELRIARSTEAGLALRTLQALRSEGAPANPAEAEEALTDLWHWIQTRADEVRRQVRPFADAGPGSVTVRVFAARLLAIGALLRGRAAPQATPTELFAHALEPWPAEETEPSERSPAWRTLWHAFHRHAELARTWLLSALACPKGAETRANILDPSSVLSALLEVLPEGEAPELPEGAEQLPAESRLKELGREVCERLSPALAAEKQACTAWAARVGELLGGERPEELAAVLEPTFREAAAQGRLLGEGALELSGVCLSLPHRELEGLLEAAGRVASLDGSALLRALGALNRQRMQEYLAFLELAGRVLDQSLSALTEGEQGATDQAALKRELSTLLDELHKHLSTLAQ
jgi:hypothetical protein